MNEPQSVAPAAPPIVYEPGHARPFWARLLAPLMRPWVRIQPTPQEPATLLPPGPVPTVYVLERRGLSDLLILERACRNAGLPSPFALVGAGGQRGRAVFGALPRRRPGGGTRIPGEPLITALSGTVAGTPGADVRVVPVSVFVGRAPARESGWFSVLFSEDWAVVGWFRRLLAVLLNGRDTHVQFAAPVSLSEVLASAPDPVRGQRKLYRILRVHFRRIRSAVIGPDLSHRRTVVDGLLNSEPVREAIAATAAKEKISLDKARARARAQALEIAADYSHRVVRSLGFLLRGFWTRLYDGVQVHHFDILREVAPGREVIYVPCHRSHVDYILLSYQLMQHGIAIPHIGAGVNLNLPVLGPILRRGGAFFLRRSFRGDALYSTVFREYMSQLFARGVSLEYFIEGGRSRTGRLLQPRAGMLSMTVRAFLRESRRPVVFQPVYIGYEKIMEGDAYIGELSGNPKQKETLLGFFRAFGVLRKRYGRVALCFGEPIHLGPLLDEHAPDWRAATGDPDSRPEWLNPLVDTLARNIQENINRAAHVNPINLLAVALLATPKHAMAEADLAAQIELSRALVEAVPYSDLVTLDPMPAAEVIAYGERMGWIRRIAHPLGDVLTVDARPGVLLSYFRNNASHLFVVAAWVACCFLNHRRMARSSIVRLGRIVYPFVQEELFLPWDEAGFERQVNATIDFLLARGILEAEGRMLVRGPGQGTGTFQLRMLARNILPAIERYYIALALLVKNGPGTLSAGELERLCSLTAQRLSLLHELNAPEFFDRSLFRGFIQKLRERRVVWNNEDARLVFDAEALGIVVRDARLILSREIRHGILKLTPEKQAELAADPATTKE